MKWDLKLTILDYLMSNLIFLIHFESLFNEWINFKKMKIVSSTEKDQELLKFCANYSFTIVKKFFAYIENDL
jgi:hypothetical protein